MITPRAYQMKAVDGCRQAFGQGAQSVLLVMPTGSGKTATATFMVRQAVDRGLTVLWLACRRELIDQAAQSLRKADLRVGVIMSGRPRDPLAPVQIASVDTLEAWDECPSADLVIFDEAHNAVAPTRKSVIVQNPKAKILGLTATPQRSDGTALGDVFEEMVIGPTVAELIELGHLVEADVIGPAGPTKTLSADPVDAWIAHSGGRPGFLFAPTVGKSKEYVERLNAAGMLAAHVDGRTAKKKRDWAINNFRNGRLDVLSSVGVYKEGTDAPRATVCMLAQVVNHTGPYLQMVGRVLRPNEGKTNALIIDLVGAVHLHGLPETERVWSLTGKPIENRKPSTSLCQCLECGSVWKASGRRSCPYCGWVMPEVQAPKIVERQLASLRERMRERLRRRPQTYEERRFGELMRTAKARGYKPGWAAHKFKDEFGRWPNGTRR